MIPDGGEKEADRLLIYSKVENRSKHRSNFVFSVTDVESVLVLDQ